MRSRTKAKGCRHKDGSQDHKGLLAPQMICQETGPCEEDDGNGCRAQGQKTSLAAYLIQRDMQSGNQVVDEIGLHSGHGQTDQEPR